MKQVLFLIIIVSLISNLLALTKKCSPQDKMVCKQQNIISCSCVNKNNPVQNAFLVKICNSPKYPVCQVQNKSIKCNCIS